MARKEVLFNEEDYTREYYLETLKMLKEVEGDKFFVEKEGEMIEL